MKTLFIGFSRPHTWKPFSAAIMAVEGTPFSHTYVRFETTNLGSLIYQASGTAVNFMGEEVFLNHNQVYDEFAMVVPDEDYLKVMQQAVKCAGLPYAIKQVFGIAYVRLMKRVFKKNVKNPFADGGASYVCSEIVDTVLAQLGCHLADDQDSIGPGEIYAFLLAFNRSSAS